MIASAQYGALDPDEVIQPYDLAVNDLATAKRAAWGSLVTRQLADRFGSLSGAVFEIHAGAAYVTAMRGQLQAAGAQLVEPLRGLRIGEQLHWYAHRRAHDANATDALWPHTPTMGSTRAGAIVAAITAAFNAGALDLSLRPNAPPPGWGGLPEVVAIRTLREAGAGSGELRRFLTFIAAMNRARDADRLWAAGVHLWRTHRWTFDPQEVATRPLAELAVALRGGGVSQRHGPDTRAWRTIAETLTEPGIAPATRAVLDHAVGDARELLNELTATTTAGTSRVPLLGGPKIGPLWVRMLVFPGDARISSLEIVPVAVDRQVRKVTEYLGATDTAGLDLKHARPVIQRVWRTAVSEMPAVGPSQLGGTAAALDPALWFFGKWGCTHCERSHARRPIADVCRYCRYSPTS